MVGTHQTTGCIIANYNNSEYLERCVSSVLAQTCRVDEIIIADDASTDNSRQIIAELAAKNDNIIPVYQEKNLGVSRTRHQAIISSRAQFITTLDSDDFYYPTKIESELQAIFKTGSDVAFSDIVLVDRYGNKKAVLDLEYFNNLNTEEKISALIDRKMPIPRDMLFRREVYDKVGGFSDSLKVYEDFDLKLRILTGTDAGWVYSRSPGTAYRVLSGGLSRSRPIGNMIQLYRILFDHSSAIINKTGFSRFMMSLLDLTVFHFGKIFSRPAK